MQWDPLGAGVLVLPSGRSVRGRRLTSSVDVEPDWGLYATWRPPRLDWPGRWIRWPDFGLPLDSAAARDAIHEGFSRIQHQRVEVACGGGRGRTGTLLAAFCVLDGLAPAEAIGWVREHYDRQAVETPWQARWLTL